jgi:hypothetical protein
VQMSNQMIAKGEIMIDFQDIDSIRERVIREMRDVAKSQPVLAWG